MNNIENIKNQENTIQTVQLNESEFDCLQYYIGCKGKTRIVISTEEVLEDLSFCLSKEDKKLILELKPKTIKFVKM